MKGRKKFFFEKKNQKTFATFTRDVSPSPGQQEQKSFLVLFFKKELLAFLPAVDLDLAAVIDGLRAPRKGAGR